MTDPTDPFAPSSPPDAGPPPPAPVTNPTPTPWRPPRDRDSNVASIVVGLILVGIGAWYFLEQTVGIRMPRISWRDLWPVLLIALGAFIVLRSLTRRD